MKIEEYRLSRLAVSLLAVTCSINVLAQDPLRNKAEVVLAQLGISDELRADGRTTLDRFGGAQFDTSNMHFSFVGSQQNLSQFSWYSRMDEIRRRGSYHGQALVSPSELIERAQQTLSKFKDLDSTWAVKRLMDANDPKFGEQQEFVGGALGVEFERVVNGLPAIGRGAQVIFDSKDGKPVRIEIYEFKTTFLPAEGAMSPANAEARAREYITSYLQRHFPAAYAGEIIGNFADASKAQVILHYGFVTKDFGNEAEVAGYLQRRETPPMYSIDFGPVVVQIHAVTGTCLGGGVKTGSPEPPPQTAGGGRSPQATEPQGPEGKEPVAGAANGAPPLAFIVPAVAVVLLGVFLAFRAYRAR